MPSMTLPWKFMMRVAQRPAAISRYFMSRTSLHFNLSSANRVSLHLKFNSAPVGGSRRSASSCNLKVFHEPSQLTFQSQLSQPRQLTFQSQLNPRRSASCCNLKVSHEPSQLTFQSQLSQGEIGPWHQLQQVRRWRPWRWRWWR